MTAMRSKLCTAGLPEPSLEIDLPQLPHPQVHRPSGWHTSSNWNSYMALSRSHANLSGALRERSRPALRVSQQADTQVPHTSFVTILFFGTPCHTSSDRRYIQEHVVHPRDRCVRRMRPEPELAVALSYTMVAHSTSFAALP
jgi:hypothetical protein